MRIVEVFELDNKRFAVVHGDELKSGMIISKISTPFGVLDVKGSPVKEACFCPGNMQGLLLLEKDAVLEPCEAEILEYTFERRGPQK